jgi:hypothetical protein
LIDKNWRESQFTPVFVSRNKPNGRIILGSYVVDMQCLGLKDTAFYHDLDIDDYNEQMEVMQENMGVDLVKIDPNLCFNIIYGSVEFAEDCGFHPHKDFAISKYILEDVESIEYVGVPFGKDGKPFFVAGPYDDAKKIMATLAKNVGEGNFDYLVGIPGEDD